jgi:hypothetical protein
LLKAGAVPLTTETTGYGAIWRRDMKNECSWEGMAVGFIFGMALTAPFFYWLGTQAP